MVEILWSLNHMDIVIAVGVVILVLLCVINYWAKKFYRLLAPEKIILEEPKPPRL